MFVEPFLDCGKKIVGKDVNVGIDYGGKPVRNH